MIKKYLVLRDSELEKRAVKGTTVYSQAKTDYGLASQDTRALGYYCISVTLNSDGDYPGFVMPLHDLHLVENEHGFCPKCGVDFDGDLVYNHFLKEENGNHERALEIVEMYGATQFKGRWSHKIGLYSMEKDRTVAWKCHKCDHTWS